MEIDLKLTEKSAKNTQRWWKLTATKVCPTVEDGPKLKLAFWYPVSQFSSYCQEILQPLGLLSSHLATILKISRNSI